MSTKPLDRLLFAQGGVCFFRKQALPRSDASVEHLLAVSRGGGNTDENRVACCKTLNALLGSMSLKEKFQVLLNQKGVFSCPNRIDGANAAESVGAIPNLVITSPDRFSKVLANLKHHGTSKPRTIKRLRSAIAAFAKDISEAELDALLKDLQSSGAVVITGEKVAYSL
jgi:hypothetical protein